MVNKKFLKLKIAVGFKLKDSSWGGGNQFALSLVKAAKLNGHKIVHKLKDNDIDIILLTDPRSYNPGVTFGSVEILNYLFFKNKNAIVVHRINECDERKNTNHMNYLLKLSNYCADYNVFISSWLKDLNLYQKNKPSRVILNGGDREIFRTYKGSFWDMKSPLKIVTHHWSPNLMKGFDVYMNIDNMLLNLKEKLKIKFTYIGNLPTGFSFKKTKHLKPISGRKLGLELSKHHIYLSASINEPAGMHHIEGALCGMPLVYRESGALPEYCKDYGVGFKGNDYLPALKQIIENYPEYKEKVLSYPYDSKKMTDEYFQLFEELLRNRKLIVNERSLLKYPLVLVGNLLFMFLKLRNVVRLPLFNKLKNS